MIQELKDLCTEVREFIATSGSRPHFSQSEQAFQEFAERIFDFQFTHNKPYQAYCRSLGKSPEHIGHYRDIPCVVTSAFKELDLTVLPSQARTRVFFSSGTTGEKRSRHFHNADTVAVYEESLQRWFKPFVLPDRECATFLSLIPKADDAANSSLAHMIERLGLQFGDEIYSAEQIDPEVPFENRVIYLGYLDKCGRWQTRNEGISCFAEVLSSPLPVVICGTAFSFVHLCDFLAARKQFLDFPPGSRVFETGGYKGRSRQVSKEELHEMISRRLGIPETFIVSEYGMSELSSQAYDRVAGNDSPRCFRFPPWVRSEIVSPENGRPVGQGETGLVRIWDLANVGSVLAIQTEDLATRFEDGFVLAGRAANAEVRGCSLMIG